MRQAGMLPAEREAQRFADYLLTLGIESKLEANGGQWIVWIRDESHLERGKQELATFRENMDDDRYVEAERAAVEVRRVATAKVKQAQRNQVNMSDQWRGRRVGSSPLSNALIGISILVAMLTRLGKDIQPYGIWLYISGTIGGPPGWPFGLEEVASGQIWRVITPIFLHFGPLHLLFNMLWLWDLGGLIERRRGSARLAGLVVIAAIVSNLAQYFASGPVFGGMSGVVFALFGFVWMRSRFDPRSSMYLHSNTVFMMIAWFFICLTGAAGPVADWAHGAGLVVGLIVGFLPPLRRLF